MTFTPANEITTESLEYQILGRARNAWAGPVLTHIDRWFTSFHPGTMQHDAMALALAMRMPFLDVGLIGVDLDALERMKAGDHQVFLTHSADYRIFREWLQERLRLAVEGHAPRSTKT